MAGPGYAMTTRRRWVAGLALGFLGVALAVVALNSRSGPADVQLLFLGYTNVFTESRSGTFSLRKAMLLVTNCGSAPVRFLPIWDAYGITNMGAHLHSYALKIPTVLKPGESARAELFFRSDGEIFRAELAYYRLSLTHRLTHQAHSSTNAAVRAVARLISRQPKPRWGRSEPITNFFTSYVSRYHITAPPSPVTYDMLFAPRNE